MGWQPSFRAEGRLYANYIQPTIRNARSRSFGKTISSVVICTREFRTGLAT